MKITSIQPQKKCPGRYSVYVDSEFAFGLSEEALIHLGLTSSQEIDQTQLEELRKQAGFYQVYDKALKFLAIRMRSKKEMMDYLNRKGVDADHVTVVMDRLVQAGLINDEQFARQWVDWRQNSSPRSRRRLHFELSQKGVEGRIVEDALAEVDTETEVKQVKDLLVKHAGRYDTRQKLMAYLSRQGYSYGVILQALDDEE